MKLFILSIGFLAISLSFKSDSYPCHPNGDIGPCGHRVHAAGDIYPCSHFDGWGNRMHPAGDIGPCEHIVHPAGDIYPCTHICW